MAEKVFRSMDEFRKHYLPKPIEPTEILYEVNFKEKSSVEPIDLAEMILSEARKILL